MTTTMQLLEAIVGTAEVMGKELSPVGAQMLAQDLSVYSPGAVIQALAKCRKELRTFPTVADIVARIDDGRPGPEEAWAMIPKDERQSVVWTEEMAAAFDACRHLIGYDLVAARMAFREAYSRELAGARSNARPVHWSPSLGFDRHGRESVVLEAVTRGRLTAQHAQELLPDASISPRILALISGATKRLT